jgi:hypothetical protein
VSGLSIPSPRVWAEFIFFNEWTTCCSPLMFLEKKSSNTSLVGPKQPKGYWKFKLGVFFMKKLFF